MRISLPLLASSRRARAREEGLGEVVDGGSGPYGLGGDWSGEEGGEEEGEVSGEGVGLGKRALFLWKKEGSLNRPSKG